MNLGIKGFFTDNGQKALKREVEKMDINEIGDVCKVRSLSSQKINKDNGFKKIFDRKLAEIHGATSKTSLDFKGGVLEQGDKILHLLDDYARELTDPAKTLKDIEPLVESIRKEVCLIEAEAAEKVRNDYELESFIKDLAVTANVAVFKFHRGDYV